MRVLTLALLALFVCSPVHAQSLTEFGVVAPPYGFVGFCVRNPRECAQPSTLWGVVKTTPTLLALLDNVNSTVNQKIKPETDQEHFGISEYWTLPNDGIGDCEDYALLKRRVLITKGFNPSALRLTVVVDENGDGHLVLIVITDGGDIVLDNKFDAVYLPRHVPYRFIMRQSGVDPVLWVSLEATTATAP